ncbi:MAG: TetR/AcrR family transcriptional regulator [Acidimicrobiia bacterium]|nr:TetR/AcrR family transcriptional regulator [Acidimicrobiia bacterium]
MNEKPRVGAKRPGGRAARVRSSVLTAVAELLNEIGYDNMSIEQVADRAGVHPTTVYRRWPTKPELVFDAVSVESEEVIPIPDTGTLEGDLRVLARAVVANIGSEGGTRRSRSLVAAASTSDQLAERMQAFWAHRFGLTTAIIERAIDRHELSPGTDPNLIIETLIGPLWVRVLLTGEPVTNQLADHVAEIVAAGATKTTA